MCEITERLKATSKVAGQLFPILVDKQGKIIDGKHRFEANQNWKRLEWDVDELTAHRARLVMNAIRRQVDPQDYNEFAEYLLKTEPGDQPYRVASGLTIAERISELTGIPERTVYDHLKPEFKRTKEIIAGPAITATEKVTVPESLAEPVRQMVERVKEETVAHPEKAREIVLEVKQNLEQTNHTKQHAKVNGLKMTFGCDVCGAELTATLIHNSAKRHSVKDIQIMLRNAER